MSGDNYNGRPKTEFRVVFNAREKAYLGPFYTAKSALRTARKRAKHLGQYVLVQARDDGYGGKYGTSWTDVREVAPPRGR